MHIAISGTHNKNLSPLLNLPSNCRITKSVPQILSIKGECTLPLLNYLVIG